MKKGFGQLGKAVCYFLLFLGMQSVIVTLIEIVYGIMAGVRLSLESGGTDTVDYSIRGLELAADFIMEYAVPITVFADCLAVLVVVIFFLIRKKNFWRETCICRFQPAMIPWILLLGISLTIVIETVLGMLPEEAMEEYSDASSLIVTEMSVLSILAEAVLIPIVEEIFFRGLVFTRLRKGMPLWLAIIVSAAIFGIAHGTNPVWFGYVFVLGVVFAYVAHYTGSIIPTMMLHMIFNLLGGFIFPEFGDRIPGIALLIAAIVALVLIGVILIVLRGMSMMEVRPLDRE